MIKEEMIKEEALKKAEEYVLECVKSSSVVVRSLEEEPGEFVVRTNYWSANMSFPFTVSKKGDMYYDKDEEDIYYLTEDGSYSDSYQGLDCCNCDTLYDENELVPLNTNIYDILKAANVKG